MLQGGVVVGNTVVANLMPSGHNVVQNCAARGQMAGDDEKRGTDAIARLVYGLVVGGDRRQNTSRRCIARIIRGGHVINGQRYYAFGRLFIKDCIRKPLRKLDN